MELLVPICYKVDNYILRRVLQGYKIPSVKSIAVDEVYARSPKQQKDGETRDDLFLTVIVNFKTRKVIRVKINLNAKLADKLMFLGNNFTVGVV